jgi:hypothetical protein
VGSGITRKKLAGDHAVQPAALLGKQRMSGNPQYNLWFVNQSISAGKLCVYQDGGNVAFNQATPDTLAWMVTGANPSVQVNFKWDTDYDFAWFDYGSTSTQQIESAGLNAGNAVTLSLNQYGYYFKAPPTSGPSGRLSIQMDASIPSINDAVAGIGMHGAGTFASPAGPNINLVCTPAQVSGLAYWVSFGPYTFEVNDSIDVSTLNTPAKISFPYGVYTMTAVLNSQNLWSVYSGPPVAVTAPSSGNVVVYEAGKGILP